MSEQESAFLLKQRLKLALDEYPRRNPYPTKDELQKLDEVKALLRAGSEILRRRLREREAEAAEMFKQGLSDLADLGETIRLRIKEEGKERRKSKAERQKREEERKRRITGKLIVLGLLALVIFVVLVGLLGIELACTVGFGFGISVGLGVVVRAMYG